MSYVEENLQPGEQVEHTGRLHWIIYLPGAFFLCIAAPLFMVAMTLNDGTPFGVVGTMFLLPGALIIAAARAKRQSSEFAITNRRLIIKTGGFGRHVLELLLQKVEAIRVEEPFVGRLFGYGSIVVSGTGGTKERFNSIADPMEFRNHVQNHATATHETRVPSKSSTGPFCSRCGARNAEQSRFCNGCGFQLAT